MCSLCLCYVLDSVLFCTCALLGADMLVRVVCAALPNSTCHTRTQTHTHTPLAQTHTRTHQISHHSQTHAIRSPTGDAHLSDITAAEVCFPIQHISTVNFRSSSLITLGVFALKKTPPRRTPRNERRDRGAATLHSRLEHDELEPTQRDLEAMREVDDLSRQLERRRQEQEAEQQSIFSYCTVM